MKGPGHFAPGSESSREWNGQGVNGPGSERAKDRIGQGPIGRFAPGSELAREQKGSVPLNRHQPIYMAITGNLHVLRVFRTHRLTLECHTNYSPPFAFSLLLTPTALSLTIADNELWMNLHFVCKHNGLHSTSVIYLCVLNMQILYCVCSKKGL